MFPPFWGLPAASSAVLQQIQREIEQMQDRFDTVFKSMLGPHAAHNTHTPSDVVYAEGKLRLLRFRPVAEQLLPVPLLIVPSVISGHHMLDLAPGRSLAEYLIRQGVDVYVLDWGTPGPEDRFVPFDQYITGGLRRAVQRVRTNSGQQRISLLGYCMGGTLTAIFSALYGSYVRNLIQLAAPIDFHDGSLLAQWTAKERFNVDLIVDTLGSMPAELMRASFQMIKPTAQIAQSVVLADRLGDLQAVQDFLALQAWLGESIPFPGEAYRKYIKDCYQENYLVQGKLVVDRRRVDLRQIDAALLNITAEKDLIVTAASANALNGLVASADAQALTLPGGHVGLVSGHTAMTQLWPQLAGWLIARSAAPAIDSAAHATDTAPAQAERVLNAPAADTVADLAEPALNAPAADTVADLAVPGVVADVPLNESAPVQTNLAELVLNAPAADTVADLVVPAVVAEVPLNGAPPPQRRSGRKKADPSGESSAPAKPARTRASRKKPVEPEQQP